MKQRERGFYLWFSRARLGFLKGVVFVRLPVPSDKSDSGQIARFGTFEADLRTGELRKNGARIKIQELPFRALKLLITHPNEILSRDEFRKILWPEGVFVDFDRGISSAINRVRESLGDSAENPRFVETVGRRGYRWIAPTLVSELPPPVEIHAAVNAEEAIDDSAHQAEAEPIPYDRNSRRQRMFIIVPLLIGLLFVAWFFWKRHRSTEADSRPSSLSRPVSSGTSAGLSLRAANSEAADFYLKGRFYWNERTPESLTKAVDAFTQAIVHDPNYAPAYVGLADCYNLLREYSTMPSSEAYPRALAAAKRAVELDPQSSEAHASLAFVLFYGMWDVAAADREFKRALELNPNNATAHHWYATYLETIRRFPESLAEIERARALDPSSRSVLADKALILYVAGQKSDAVPLLQQLETIAPDFISPHRYLEGIYLDNKEYDNYLTEVRKEAELVHDSSMMATAEEAQKGYAAEGGRGLLKALYREQKKLYSQGKYSPSLLANTCSLLGYKQEAMLYLNAAYEQHSDGLVQIEVDGALNPLHDDPAFRNLIARIGLPPLN